MASEVTSMRAFCDEVRTIDFSGISNAYAPIGTRLASAIRILHAQNLTDSILMFSYDGLVDHFPLNSQAYVIIDITTNQALTQGFFMPAGQRLYVRDMTDEGYNAPTIGAVWLTVYSGRP